MSIYYCTILSTFCGFEIFQSNLQGGKNKEHTDFNCANESESPGTSFPDRWEKLES